MGAKYTPGPWFLFKNRDWEVHGDGGLHVLATLNRTEMDYSEKQAITDARLIAAAPDLYEACRAALRDEMDSVELLRAAIRKAEQG